MARETFLTVPDKPTRPVIAFPTGDTHLEHDAASRNGWDSVAITRRVSTLEQTDLYW